MTRRLTAVGLAATALLAGCGSTHPTIGIPTIVATLHQSGFATLKTWSYAGFTKQFEKTATGRLACSHTPAGHCTAPDLSVVYVPAPGGAKLLGIPFYPLMSSLSVTRFASESAAANRLRNDQPLLAGHVPAALRSALPRAYTKELLSAREARICNVVVTMLNPSHQASLTRKFALTTRLLQKRC